MLFLWFLIQECGINSKAKKFKLVLQVKQKKLKTLCLVDPSALDE